MLTSSPPGFALIKNHGDFNALTLVANIVPGFIPLTQALHRHSPLSPLFLPPLHRQLGE